MYQMYQAEFNELQLRLKFKPRLKYGWFHLILYSIFQLKPFFSDLSRGSNSLNSDTDKLL